MRFVLVLSTILLGCASNKPKCTYLCRDNVPESCYCLEDEIQREADHAR